MQHQNPRWHTLTPDMVAERLKTDLENGLSPKIGRTRLERFGRNELFLPQPCSISHCIKRILSDASLLLLALLCVIALCFDRISTALTVLFVLAVSCTVSIVAYVKTNRVKESMSAYASPRVHLIRGGQELSCDAASVVPGDLLLLRVGDVIPCDARLISQYGAFEVYSYRMNAKGTVSYEPFQKDATVIYSPKDCIEDGEYINMVFAGSIVHSGEAMAIVTETGEMTELGRECGPHPLAMQVGEPSYMAPMRRYMNRYSIILCALILPVAIIGLFAGRGRLDILDVLLISLSLVVSSMSEQLLSMGRIVCACAVLRAAAPGGDRNHTAMIKNYFALDELGRVDELILYGKEALSDGHLHPYAAYVADGLFIGHKMKNAAVSQMYETVYRYERCITESTMIDTDHRSAKEWSIGVSELGQMLKFDRASADIRTLSLAPVPAAPEWVEAIMRSSNATSDRRFRIHRCTQPEPLLRCNAGNRGGRTVPFNDAERQKLFDMFCHLKNQGTQVCAYVREEKGYVIFEGILSFREAYDPALREVRRALESNGVRVSLFLPEEGNSYLNDLMAIGWIESESEALMASQLKESGKTLSEMFEKKRVFLGFPRGAATLRTIRCREAGKTTAVLGLSPKEPTEAPIANVMFACEPVSELHGIGKELPIVPADFSVAGTCDQSARRTADVLVRRAGADGGGLAGVAHAIETARSIAYRMMLTMQYLLVAQLLRVVLVVLPMVFGWQTLSPPLLLISGIWVDLAYVLICAFHHCTSDVLKKAPDYTKFFKAPLRSRPDWVCAAVICGIFSTLGAWVLQWAKVAPEGRGLALYMFLALLTAQSCLLFCLLRTAGRLAGRWRAHAASLLVLLVLITLLAIVILISPIAAWFGAQGWSWLLVLLSLLSPLYLLGSYFISLSYRHKIVRTFRYYFRGISRKIRKQPPPEE